MSLKIAQSVLALPGELDITPVIHSNSPELVLQSGVLLSTFSRKGKKFPEAHLEFPLLGNFDLFFHHSTDCLKTKIDKTLFIAVIASSANNQPLQLEKRAEFSFSTKPDAPFLKLGPLLANDDKNIYAGPGDRVALSQLDSLIDETIETICLAADEIRVLQTVPLPKGSPLHPLNGRTGLFKFVASGPVYIALVAVFAKPTRLLSERRPNTEEIIDVFLNEGLVKPRDQVPSLPGAPGQLIYGRVAGVVRGSCWRATINSAQDHCSSNRVGSNTNLSIIAGDIFSYPVSTLSGGTLGTDQIQSAEIIVRYPDTAYQSHGNYGVRYNLKIPIQNKDSVPVLVGLTFQSPLKNSGPDSLRFLEKPSTRIVFRGTVKFCWKDANDLEHNKYFHLVQTEGMPQESLVEFRLEPEAIQEITFSVVYPADCTPPQVLTIAAKNSS